MSRFNLSTARKKLLGEGVWVAVGQLLVALATLLGVRLLTEVVSPAVYGSVALILGLAALGQNLFSSPLLNAAYRFYAELGGQGTAQLRAILARPLQLTTTGLVILLLLGGGVYVQVTGGLSWFAFVAVSALMSAEIYRGMEWSFLGAARRQKAAALWQGLEAWVRPLLAISLVLLWEKTPTAVLSGYALATGGLFLAVIAFFPDRLEGVTDTSSDESVSVSEEDSTNSVEGAAEPSAEEEESSAGPDLARPSSLQRDIFHYALPLMPVALVGWVSSLGDRYIIGGVLGAAQVGIYAAVYGSILRPFQILSAVVSQTLLPVFNQSLAQNNRSHERKLFWTWLALIAFFSLLGAVLITLLSDWIAWLLLAKAYRSSAPLMGLLALGFTFLNIAHVFEYQLYSYKHTRFILLGQTLAAIASLAVAVPMIRWKGLWGAAMACPMYYFLYLLLMAGLHRIAASKYHQNPSSSSEETAQDL